MSTEEQNFRVAKQKLAKRKAYFHSVFSWLSTSFFLFILNMMTSPGTHWWRIVFISWGIGIFFKTMKLLKENLWDNDWEANQLQHEMSRMKRKKKHYYQKEESVLDLNQPRLQKEAAPKYWNERDFV